MELGLEQARKEAKGVLVNIIIKFRVIILKQCNDDESPNHVWDRFLNDGWQASWIHRVYEYIVSVPGKAGEGAEKDNATPSDHFTQG